MATAVAKRFGCLPSQARRALADDPDQIDLVALGLLDYADALAVHKSADKKAIDAWKDSPAMKAVQEYDAEMVRAELPSREELLAAGFEVFSEDEA